MRGVKSARLFVGDGNLGLWAAVGEIYPQAQEQLCWNHKMLNVMDAVSKKEQVQARVRIPTQIGTDSAGKSTLVPIEIGTGSEANRHPCLG